MNDVFVIILVVLVSIGIFFFCRELNCWYWKINARMDLMEKMCENQEKIIKLLKGDSQDGAGETQDAQGEETKEKGADETPAKKYVGPPAGSFFAGRPY